MKGKNFIKKSIACILSVCMLISGIRILNTGTVYAADNTTVYFLNTQGWESVNAYVWLDNAPEPLGGWPGTPMTIATEIGDKWYKVDVPLSSNFHVIINNDGTQFESYVEDSYGSVYLTAQNDVLYPSAKAAETAMGIESGSSGGGSNSDLNYDVDLNDTGASLPYITYEAEAADTNATILNTSTVYLTDIQSEAGGRQAVKLVNTGDYIEFTLSKPANAMVIRYSIPDSSDGTGINADLSMYVDGKDSGNLSLTSKYAWVYGEYPYTNYPGQGSGHRFFDETRTFFNEGTLSSGTKIKLQKDSSDTAEYYVIDFIECELVEPALTKPDNALSVTDYGAIADDGNDDYQAFLNCISAAKNSGKEVWIPAGNFNLAKKQAIDVSDVTIRGAGMWYTNLTGAGASFHYQGTCKFYDFSLTGVSTVRDDGGDLAGFEGVGTATNVTIENIWMEHMKVGVWSYNTTGLVIQGCRIRNTYADGINMCSATNDAAVRNNNIRNTGDDCIAIWPWQGDSSNNTIAYNTIQFPTLANGIAVYGGFGNIVEHNYVADTINNGSGICIGTDYDTPNGFSGTTVVSNNILVRCGSYHCDYSYPVGAIWIWATKSPMTANYIITENTLFDCSYEGVLFDCWNTVTGVTIKDTDIYGCTDGIYIRGNTNCSATFDNVGVAEYSGQLIKKECTGFLVTQTGSGVYETSMPEINLPAKVPVTEGLEINGFQISTTLGGSRTIYSIESVIDENSVVECGLVYGLCQYITADDVFVGSNSSYVAAFSATDEGILNMKFGSETSTSYAMTMTQNIGTASANALTADYYVRAYAKLSDDSYVYSDVANYSVYSVANYLYQNGLMNVKEQHDYLFDNILSVVDSNYTKIAYTWNRYLAK